MTLKEKIELNKGIVAMDISDNNSLLTVDEVGNFREYSLEDYKLTNSLKTKLHNSTWNRRISFSRNGEYLIYGMPESSYINVFSIATKEILYKIEDGFHQGEIISTVTGSENKYFISTSREGRAFLWNIQTGNSVFTFPKHIKSVNIAIFNSTNNIVVTGGDDGSIQLYDISLMKPLKLIRHNLPIRGFLFLSDKYLISLDKKNQVILWRYSDGKQVKVMIENDSVITKMTLSKDEKFLFLSTIKGTVILYNLIEHKIINPAYISIPTPITNIVTTPDSGNIIISDTTGGIYFYSAHNDQIILSKYIRAKKYQEAYNLIQKNDLLKFTQEAEILEMVWHKVLAKSKEMLETEMKDTIKVELMLEPFAIVPEKKEIIDTILDDFKQYSLLIKFINKESYYLAYDIIEKYPSLEKTRAFKRLESIWQDYFRRAKSKLFEKSGEEEAKEILSKFRGVSSKAFTIKTLFQQKNIYIQFQNAIKKHKYNEILKIVHTHNFLETNKDYQEILHKLDDTYIQMRIAIRKNKLGFAREKAKILIGIDDYKNEAEASLKEIEIHSSFQTLLRSSDLNQILEMVETHSYLKNYPEVIKIDNRWKDVVFKAQELASYGEIDKVLKTLEEFNSVKVKFRKIANIFKIAYLSDLHNTVADNQEELSIVIPILKRGIEKYLLYFGKDQEIKDLVEEIRNTSGEKIDLFQFEVGNIENWKPDFIKDSIIQ